MNVIRLNLWFRVSLFAMIYISAGLLMTSCESSVNSSGNGGVSSFSEFAFDYSDNHYFFDTLYRRSFREFYSEDSLSNYVIENTLKDLGDNIEVWVQCDVTEPRKRLCVGVVMLDTRPQTGYDTSVTNPEIISGRKFFGWFTRLEKNFEYYINNRAGFIGFNISLPQNYHAGVVYQNYKDEHFGIGERESSSTDTLILKLFKVDNQIPSIAPLAWQLKMKNVYRIPFENIQSGSLIKVLYNNNSVFTEYIPGYQIPMVTILRLDRYKNISNLPPPDGKFDWLENKTIYPRYGDVIFPDLEPFYTCIRDAGLDSTYQYKELYIYSKLEATQSVNAFLYKLSGNAVY